jgi:mono/diheme cytochrome c family protein
MSATVLLGKQLFYDARDARLARDSYMSCASCHHDGAHDGRTWDIGAQGEGLRNTISLRGRAGMGHGRLHWSGNFDEVQDFEGQIRSLAGGTGLMSDAAFATGTRNQPLGNAKAGVSTDLDALAAYVNSLSVMPQSAQRSSTGVLTADAVAGRAVFAKQNCASCHGGTNFATSGLLLADDYRSTQSGWYLQSVYQFTPRWRVGARYDSLDSGTPHYTLAPDGLLSASPDRLSLMLDWNPSEFSRLRAQYDLDDARDDSDTDRVLRLQYLYGIGAHGAHKY